MGLEVVSQLADGDRHRQPVQLIGGGSGIVPLMSMIRSRASTNNAGPFRLLYSVREPQAVFYRDDLKALCDGHGSVSVSYVYTRAAPKGWTRPPGRIDAALVASSTWPSHLGPTCYVCGPTSFVEIAAGLLTACGNSPDTIRTERFGPTGERK
jgi:ferredoxin-NADP reductase